MHSERILALIEGLVEHRRQGNKLTASEKVISDLCDAYEVASVHEAADRTPVMSAPDSIYGGFPGPSEKFKEMYREGVAELIKKASEKGVRCNVPLVRPKGRTCGRAHGHEGMHLVEDPAEADQDDFANRLFDSQHRYPRDWWVEQIEADRAAVRAKRDAYWHRKKHDLCDHANGRCLHICDHAGATDWVQNVFRDGYSKRCLQCSAHIGWKPSPPPEG